MKDQPLLYLLLKFLVDLFCEIMFAVIVKWPFVSMMKIAKAVTAKPKIKNDNRSDIGDCSICDYYIHNN